ncbi:nectin-3-like protein [Chanos chanos]|uniref:Nectin-3-like protein n=1 Tax=Chanos chanos TaxID=29144 RepID=A0A6J2WDB1_CHACN|nr:nectin-3-like protein [Chanos chanos]
MTERLTFIGNFAENNGSIQLKEISLTDEGVYSCIFTLFSAGSYETMISLTVLVCPEVKMSEVTPLVGESEEVMATCTAAGARPPANISWHLGSFSDSMKTMTNSTAHLNGTYTNTSHLIGVPSRHANQQQVQCVVNHVTRNQILNYTINVHCAQGDRLILLSQSPDLNGLYICKASNQYGEASGSIYVFMTSETPKIAVICLVLLSLVIVIGLLCWIKSKKYPG